MKIVRFLGGLGNQMFQYAFYKALQKRFPNVKADLQGYTAYALHNGLELENIFNIQLNKAPTFTSNLYYLHNRKWIYRKLRQILNLRKSYKEEQILFSFDPFFLENPTPAYYWGYWQNHQYFSSVAKELQLDFRFKNPLTPQNQETLAQIQQSNSVSIHIRRGDYLKDPFLGGLCRPEYYQQAISYIQTRVSSPEFFIFSDDISWCREKLSLPDSNFISWNTGTESYIDMQLMSGCKHQIIANSSFSWWAAWLNVYPEKIVICPKKWANDPNPMVNMSFPDKWISL